MRQIIYLIRHGNTTGTENGILYGSTELPVTEKGLEDIRSLAAEGIYPDPDGADLYTSGMLRTEQTFEAIYGDLPHETAPLLREMGIGIYEMMPVREVLRTEFGRAWLSGEIEEPYLEGGESVPGFARRISEGIHEIIDRNEANGTGRTIIVAHGGPIAHVMQEFFPGIFDNVWDWTPGPGLGVGITFDSGKATGWEPIGDVDFGSVIASQKIAAIEAEQEV